MTVRINDHEVKFNVYNALKYIDEPEHCNAIKAIGQDYEQKDVIEELFCKYIYDTEYLFDFENEKSSVMFEANNFESLDLQSKDFREIN